ncbi:MAG: NHLP bacteriocin export ABC transporter permease/ATPase subunit [Thermoflexales bacterium]|nr:NHLP bacteriocin export ABC transporter permease/ATPase subunit [Thermoflexales bacterium]
MRLRYKEGRLIRADSSSPILLTDPETAWVVYTGRVDVFLVPIEQGRVVGTRQHLLRAQVGQVVLGAKPIAPTDTDVSVQTTALMAVGDPDTQLLRVKRAALAQFIEAPMFAEQAVAMLEGWVAGLSASLVRQAPPSGITVLVPGDEIKLNQGQIAHPNHGVVWVKHTSGGSHFMGNANLPVASDSYLPLSNRTWLEASTASQVSVVNTPTWLRQDPTWSALDAFNQLALTGVQRSMADAQQAERDHWQRRATADRQQVAQALTRLASILLPQAAAPFGDVGDSTDALLAACRLVGQASGITIQPPPASSGRVGQDPLREIARASRIRLRPVTLHGHWWREDSGPLLAYVSPTSNTAARPVALLPRSGRRSPTAPIYDLLDPKTQTRVVVTADVAALLTPLAYVLYAPLPDRALTGLDLLRHGLRGNRRDVWTMVLAGLALGSLMLITPLMVGVLFDSIIPGFQRDQLIQIGLALLVSALAAAMFQLTRNVAVLRLESKLDASVQAAIVDRLLRLPAPFFRRYTSGDLAERVLGINYIRYILSGTVVSALLLGLFSILNVVLLFAYAPDLAWRAIGLVLIAVLVTGLLGWRQVRYQRLLTEAQRHISGLVLQIFSGIAKLRMAGVEDRAFARWAKAFSRQREMAYKSRAVSNGLAAFNAAYPVLTSLALFAMIGLMGEQQRNMSTGAFLAFYAAFTQFLLASLSVSSTLTSLLSIAPLYAGIKPLLQTAPEVSPVQADPGTLTGEIELSHVAFRYREDEPLVLKDVSLRIRPGEFVAIVGASGCGKSTLLRLLLKFESPASGSIYYDGQDLERLDVEAVRRQAGVVLQNGQLMSGSLLTNIIGSSLLTLEDAWEAIRQVGLGPDVEQMPMNIHTVISEGGNNLSGGQRQRVLIARAIVHKPRLIFLDEATSALDNPSQALVSASLERLSATRVVIAHRLSTIVNADCIYVMDEGRIVQSGTYDQLMKQRGLFVDLAKRQLA